MNRPPGTPPTPSAMSSESAPVETASTGIDALSPSFMTEPAPNSRSIWVIAALSAASFALASVWLAFASLSGVWGFAIFNCLSAAPDGQLLVGHGHVLRARRPEQGTVGRDPDAKEGLQQRVRKRPRRRLDAHLAPAPAPARIGRREALLAHARDGQVGPELALLGLIEAGVDQARLDLGLELDCARAVGLDREEVRARPVAPHGDGIGQQPDLGCRAI